MQHAFIQCISVYIILYVLLIIVHEPGVLGKLRCRMARKRFIIFLYMYILSIYTVRPGVLHERLVRHSHWYHLNVCNINTWEYNCSEWKQRTRYIFFIMKLRIGNVKWESNLVNGGKKKAAAAHVHHRTAYNTWYGAVYAIFAINNISFIFRKEVLLLD